MSSDPPAVPWQALYLLPEPHGQGWRGFTRSVDARSVDARSVEVRDVEVRDAVEERLATAPPY